VWRLFVHARHLDILPYGFAASSPHAWFPVPVRNENRLIKNKFLINRKLSMDYTVRGMILFMEKELKIQKFNVISAGSL
jgi:hypothetical protein